MSDKPAGLRRKLTDYGDPGFSLFLRKAFAKSMGYTEAELDRPVIGIANTGSGLVSCHCTVPALIEAVERGVTAAGGLPLTFPTISLGEPFMHPTTMLFRNLMAMDTEEMIRAHPIDAVVLIGGCDKTVPAQLMAAASAGVPAIQLVTGPMLTGSHKGERLGACTDCPALLGAPVGAGAWTMDEIAEVGGRLMPSAGTCMVMGTAQHHGLRGGSARHDAAGERCDPRRARRPPAHRARERGARRGARGRTADAGSHPHACRFHQRAHGAARGRRLDQRGDPPRCRRRALRLRPRTWAASTD